MFARLPDDARGDVADHDRRRAVDARAGDTVAAALLAAGLRRLSHTPVRRAARSVLPDGRVLRLPGHDRRPAQPPGVHGRRAPGMHVATQHGARALEAK